MGPKGWKKSTPKPKIDLRDRPPRPPKTDRQRREETQLEDPIECDCTLYGPNLGIHTILTTVELEQHEKWRSDRNQKALSRQEAFANTTGRTGLIPEPDDVDVALPVDNNAERHTHAVEAAPHALEMLIQPFKNTNHPQFRRTAPDEENRRGPKRQRIRDNNQGQRAERVSPLRGSVVSRGSLTPAAPPPGSPEAESPDRTVEDPDMHPLDHLINHDEEMERMMEDIQQSLSVERLRESEPGKLPTPKYAKSRGLAAHRSRLKTAILWKICPNFKPDTRHTTPVGTNPPDEVPLVIASDGSPASPQRGALAHREPSAEGPAQAMLSDDKSDTPEFRREISDRPTNDGASGRSRDTATGPMDRDIRGPTPR
ncbi:hypothetical protein BJ508DRAFT_314405 [Ascobolus immersus RN42]|uniref:Uncharacterized protein n=1 Tax=Ascobolus immersus RN42 TaxID=1160509 RepID=A0A3N4HT12_ASCIM|nr:hypothetical protein BJ508DRAFT_314405 [Ascobolus immersus RN42]